MQGKALDPSLPRKLSDAAPLTSSEKQTKAAIQGDDPPSLQIALSLDRFSLRENQWAEWVSKEKDDKEKAAIIITARDSDSRTKQQLLRLVRQLWPWFCDALDTITREILLSPDERSNYCQAVSTMRNAILVLRERHGTPRTELYLLSTHIWKNSSGPKLPLDSVNRVVKMLGKTPSIHEHLRILRLQLEYIQESFSAPDWSDEAYKRELRQEEDDARKRKKADGDHRARLREAFEREQAAQYRAAEEAEQQRAWKAAEEQTRQEEARKQAEAKQAQQREDTRLQEEARQKAAEEEVRRQQEQEARRTQEARQQAEQEMRQVQAERERQKLEKDRIAAETLTTQLVATIQNGTPLPFLLPPKSDLIAKLSSAWSMLESDIAAMGPQDLTKLSELEELDVYWITPTQNAMLALRLLRRTPNELLSTGWDLDTMHNLNELLGHYQEIEVLQWLKVKVIDVWGLLREAQMELNASFAFSTSSEESSSSIGSNNTEITIPNDSPERSACSTEVAKAVAPRPKTSFESPLTARITYPEGDPRVKKPQSTSRPPPFEQSDIESEGDTNGNDRSRIEHTETQTSSSTRSDQSYSSDATAPLSPCNDGDINMEDAPEQPFRKFCTFFLKNKCKFGDRCRDLHDRQTPHQSTLSSRNGGLAQHQPSEPLPSEAQRCSHAQRYGSCKLGDKCRELRALNHTTAPAVIRGQQMETNVSPDCSRIPCKFGGHCRKKRCPFKHELELQAESTEQNQDDANDTERPYDMPANAFNAAQRAPPPPMTEPRLPDSNLASARIRTINTRLVDLMQHANPGLETFETDDFYDATRSYLRETLAKAFAAEITESRLSAERVEMLHRSVLTHIPTTDLKQRQKITSVLGDVGNKVDKALREMGQEDATPRFWRNTRAPTLTASTSVQPKQNSPFIFGARASPAGISGFSCDATDDSGDAVRDNNVSFTKVEANQEEGVKFKGRGPRSYRPSSARAPPRKRQ